MKLWPFSKKNETPAAAKPVNPHSRKMDLPQGVVLADPSESAFHPLPSQQEATTSSLPNPASETELPETTTPSFVDLSFIPENTQGSTASSAEKTPEKPDLTSFFEQNNLSFVSPSNPTEASTKPSEEKTQLTPPEPALPDFISETTTPDWMNLPALSAQDNLSPPTDSAFSFSEATSELPLTPELTNPFDFFPPELQASSEPDNTTSTDFFIIGEAPAPDMLPSNVATDFTDFTHSTPFSPVAQATQETSQTEAFKAPVFDAIPESAPDPALNPKNFQTTEPEQANNDSFFLYTTGTELQPPSDGGLFDFGFAPEAFASDFQAEVEAAFLPEAPTELPPQLNLPDEALAPNGEGIFFATTTGIQPSSDDDYAPETFGDETFDLDSLLLGESSPVSEPTEAIFGLPATDTYSLGEFEPTLYENETLETDKEHYFGDEADGLKDVDNPDSYDFGHYEDPDEPSMAFCLDETIETDQQLQELVANLAEETANESPQTDQGGAQVQKPFLQETSAEEPQSYVSMPSLPSTEDFLQTLAQPVTFDGTYTLQESDEAELFQEATEEIEPFYEEPDQEIADISESLTEDSPETALPQSTSATHQPQSQPKQVFKPKPYQDSLADRIGSFEQEVLLKNSQFLSHSINDLVNSYFAQQTQEAS